MCEDDVLFSMQWQGWVWQPNHSYCNTKIPPQTYGIQIQPYIPVYILTGIFKSSQFFGVQTWKRQSFIQKQPAILCDLLARLQG